MAYTLAVSGKGGSGKTTIAGLAVRWLVENGRKPVLAVDADPNYNLGSLLGIEVARTIADIREESLGKKSSGGAKQRELEYAIQMSIAEGKGFDLLTMGRPEGPRCYCYVNSLLRDYLSKASSSYAYVVMDNEAGMEHISRRTTSDVDLMLIVADATPVGARSAVRVATLTCELPVNVKETKLLVNRVDNGIPQATASVLSSANLKIAAELPVDPAIFECACAGKTAFDIDEASRVWKTLDSLLTEWMPENTQSCREEV